MTGSRIVRARTAAHPASSTMASYDETTVLKVQMESREEPPAMTKIWPPSLMLIALGLLACGQAGTSAGAAEYHHRYAR